MCARKRKIENINSVKHNMTHALDYTPTIFESNHHRKKARIHDSSSKDMLHIHTITINNDERTGSERGRVRER